MIKAVIFDFDHTLYDRDASYARLAPALAEELADYVNRELSLEELTARMSQADRDGAYPRGWPDVYSYKVKAGVFSTVPTYEVYIKAIRTHQPRTITLWGDTVSTLEALKAHGLKLGMLTNGGSKSQRDKLSNTPEIIPYFDEILIGGDLPAQKPHAIAYHAICEALGVAPSEAMYVGDNPANDIEGAKQAGLTAVWIPYVKPYPTGVMPPDYEIASLSDLLLLVDKLNEAQL